MKTNTDTLYHQDFYSWIYHNIELLRQSKFAEIDVETLIEELESMARGDRHELESRLIVLIAHLLKLEYQFKQLTDRWQTWQGGSWRGSIREQRLRIAKQLKNSPSLKRYLPEAITEAYPDAVEIAITETGLPKSIFPESCPYSMEQLLDEKFYPDVH
jgi:predicted unusual protein kinase regulating ubiquinone biosynthesis (AarF/ABC1/UbiB family)